MTRVKESGRAGGEDQPGDGELISHATITLDVEGYKLLSDGRSAYLTAQQARLLTVLMRHPRRVHGTEALCAAMRGDGATSDDALKVCISRLRRTFRMLGQSPALIVSVRGIGYIFDASDPA